MRKSIIFALMLIGIVANAQSLADNELERIAIDALAEEISHCPEDTIRYSDFVVQEIESGNIVANVSLFYKDGEFTYKKPEYCFGIYIQMDCKNGYAILSSVARKIIDWMTSKKQKTTPDVSFNNSSIIKHKDGWVHPAGR